MNEFLNNQETNEDIIEETVQQESISQQNAEEDFAEPITVENDNFCETTVDSENEPFLNQDNIIENNNYTPAFNAINYSEIKPLEAYKPISKGLKFFALIMALIILLTGTCVVGYFIGKNSVSTTIKPSVHKDVDLAARPTKTDEMTEAQVYEEVNKSIVGIIVYNSSGLGSQASGIIYSDDGYIVTNDHIYSEIAGAKFKVYMYDGTEHEARYVAGDKVSDLAVLKIEGGKFEPAKFGNSDDLFYGEHVVAIGRPSDATDATSITRGIISAINRRVQTTSSYSARLIQTDSAINPGSSGGALVNMYGQVVGVTSSKLASSEYDAVGYAIPTTTMKRIVEELLEKGKVVSRAKLGISYNAIDSVTAEIKGYDHVGLYLAEISEESGLYGKAEVGDIITHINGAVITSDDVVLDIIEQSYAGDIINVTIATAEGQTKTIEVELKANVSESSYVAQEQILENPGENKSESSNGGTFDFPFGE